MANEVEVGSCMPLSYSGTSLYLGGFSMLKSNELDRSDNMFNYVVGFTPQVKLGNRVALFADISFIWHIYQQYTFDMTQSHSQRGRRVNTPAES